MRRRTLRRSLIGRAAVYAMLIIGGCAFALPLYWMVATSLKGMEQLYRLPPELLPDPVRLRNYLEALTAFPFILYTKNTIVFATLVTLGTLGSSTLIAYGFSRVSWPGRDALFVVCISTMMIPWVVTMVPQFILFKRLGWTGSLRPLVIPSFFGSAFHIFLFRQFFNTIPSELSDAARVDGCPEIGILWSVILPLSRPVLTVSGIWSFLWAWNEFLGPLIYLRDSSQYVLSLGLLSFRQAYGTETELVMAASTVTTVPVIVLFFILQRRFVEGIALTGIKA